MGIMLDFNIQIVLAEKKPVPHIPGHHLLEGARKPLIWTKESLIKTHKNKVKTETSCKVK